jgi:hypothetical protein
LKEVQATIDEKDHFVDLSEDNKIQPN